MGLPSGGDQEILQTYERVELQSNVQLTDYFDPVSTVREALRKEFAQGYRM